MNIKKTTLCEIEKCYACLGLRDSGGPVLYFAGEGNGSLRAFRGERFEKSTLIWEGGGGTMSIVSLEDTDGWLLVSRGFYSMVDSAKSTIEIVRRTNGGYSHEPVAELPYLHRFGALKGADGRRWVLACSIAGYKQDKDDWSHPGAVYCAQLPEDLTQKFELLLEKLPGEFTMNHGFCMVHGADEDCAYIASKEGVFRLSPPCGADNPWTFVHVLDVPVSDIAVCDIDADGVDELAALLPFHGNECRLYKLDGTMREIWHCTENNDFYHTVISGHLGGRDIFVIGARKQKAQLYTLSWNGADYEEVVLDEGAGPSNAAILNLPDRDILLAADRMVAKADIFEFV